MTVREGESCGWRLLTSALAGGAQALGRPIGSIEPGNRADIVVLGAEQADLSAAASDHLLDIWVFVVGRDTIETVYAGGEKVVENGRHRRRDAIAKYYQSVMAGLADA